MPQATSTGRRMAAMLAAIAILLQLLCAGGIFAWRTKNPAPATAGQQPAGPAAKLSNWVEPPLSDRAARIEKLMLVFDN
jgi:hypothetical protein